MRTLSLIGLALLLAAPAAAQETDTTSVLPDSARVAGDAEAALDDLDRGAGEAELLAEHLADLAEQPLDANTAPADALAQIPALSPLIARRIARFRRENGAFGSLVALRAVEGMTKDVLAEARPYLIVRAGAEARRFPASPSPGAVLRGLQFTALQRWTRRLDLGEGYDAPAIRRVTAAGDTVFATRYLGGPARLYTRLRARYRRNVSLALVLDKDPGERFAWDPGRQSFGYDHVSGHLALRDFGRLQTVVAGDFTATFGQGVTLWGGNAFGKGRNAVRSLVRSGRGLSPYGSAEENRFFRGLAATVRLTPRLAASAFASRRTLDASLEGAGTALPGLDPNSTPGAAQVTTLAESGLHRTATELAKKDALGETLLGGALEYDGASFRVGAAGYRARFSPPIRPDSSQFYRRFDFSGQRATAASLYGRLFAGDYLFFGEAARAPGGALGGVGGVLAEVGRYAEAVVLARHFPRDFAGLHGYAFGERNGATQNETGVYAGLRLEPARRWTVKGYFDLYRFPWVRFAVPRPSSGYDARLVVEHAPRRWLSYYLQLRTETREGGADLLDPVGRPLGGLVDETRQSARLHIDYRFSERLRLRTRLEGIRYAEGEAPSADVEAAAGTDYGALLYQDVRWRPFRRLRLDARLAFFDTDSYDARVYAYENDLLYAFSVPALSGRGRRFYLLARYAPFEGVILEAKYAATRFRGVETVGSGLAETKGPRRRDIRVQVRIRF